MKRKRQILLWVGVGALLVITGYVIALIRHGFSATAEPSSLERIVARSVRDLAIPSGARQEKNPLKITADNLSQGNAMFLARCANCHAFDGSGRTRIGGNLYPKPPDLSLPKTQGLTDGEIHYIIRNGVRLTGMPAWGNPQETSDDEIWKIVLFIRNLRRPTPAEQVTQDKVIAAAHYVGSQACKKCHEDIYERWKKTPMANVVRDPREHPEAIIPDLSTNPIAKFTTNDVAFVYGSLWKQRYFTKIGDDYYPEPAQWDVQHKVWRSYVAPKGGDWWVPYYPADNMKRPTGPLCDGCHSVGYDVATKKVAEWNVGCERCHGPGSAHVEKAARDNIYNPARMDYVAANDTCIQCHCQGQPLNNPIHGQYYDWPVGYNVGLKLRDFWKLEEHKLGETSFTHYPDGTAHKNRMQGNDYVQSLMYRRGVTCYHCHDVHGTANYAQLKKPAEQLCLDCHAPMSLNGPHAATLEEHTHHKPGTPGSQCVDCHMPKIEKTIADISVSAHTFAFISPSMTDKYKIPNACNACHKDKSTAWAAEALRKWREQSPWRVE